MQSIVMPTPPPEWEEPLPTLTGRAWAFGLDLHAADVLPARHRDLSPDQARAHLFADVAPGLAARLAPGDAIVAETHRDTDMGAGPALAALRAAGVEALLGRAFDPAVQQAARAAGIVTVVLDAPAFVHTGDRLRIDLDAAKVVNLSSGDRAAIRNLDETARAFVRATLRARRPTS